MALFEGMQPLGSGKDDVAVIEIAQPIWKAGGRIEGDCDYSRDSQQCQRSPEPVGGRRSDKHVRHLHHGSGHAERIEGCIMVVP